MTKSRKVLLGVGIVATVLVIGATFLSKPRDPFLDSVSFLKNVQPKATETFVLDWGSLPTRGSAPPMPVYVMEQTKFVVPNDFASIAETAKRELKPISTGASSYPNKNPVMYIYGFTKNKEGRSIVMNIVRLKSGQTSVILSITREATWIDKAKHWINQRFGLKSKDPFHQNEPL